MREFKIVLDLDKIVALEGPFGSSDVGQKKYYFIHLVNGEKWERSLVLNSTEYYDLYNAWVG